MRATFSQPFRRPHTAPRGAAALSAALCACALSGALFAPLPAHAETPVQLEALSRATQGAGAGLALARRQIRDGDFLGALATLERVALNNPGNREARLLHAGLLCRLDDPVGSLIEFDDLRGSDFSDSLWAEATSACESGSRRTAR